MKGIDYFAWFGFFAPADTPADVVSGLNGEFGRALQVGEINQKLGQLGLDFQSNKHTRRVRILPQERGSQMGSGRKGIRG
jgi:tripartite-type tricarboxylate transporter receptor subunit TctC